MKPVLKPDRKCIFNSTIETYHVDSCPQVRLTLGMYFVFVLDWLTVFRREQILVLRLEDYAANLNKTIQKVFDFLSVGTYHAFFFWKLGFYLVIYYSQYVMSLCFSISPTGPLSKQVEAALTKRPMSNTRRAKDRILGPMLPATRNLLHQFYQPFNSKLADILNKTAFLWSYSWSSLNSNEIGWRWKTREICNSQLHLNGWHFSGDRVDVYGSLKEEGNLKSKW